MPAINSAAYWAEGVRRQLSLSLDEADHRLFAATRLRSRLLVFDTNTGKVIQKHVVVGDCDDVFYDQKRKRIYARGGDGEISVFEQKKMQIAMRNSRILQQ